MLRRVFSSSSPASTALRLVQQRVQGKLSLLPPASPSPLNTRVVFVTRSSAPALQQSLPFPVAAAALRDFHARPREHLYVYPTVDHTNVRDQRVLLMGLGDAADVTPDVLRDATCGALRVLRKKRVKDVVVHVPELGDCGLETGRVVELVAQALALSNYQFDQYLSVDVDVEEEKAEAIGDKRRNAPLEEMYVDAPAEFQQVRERRERGVLMGSVGIVLDGLVSMWGAVQSVEEQATVGEETIFARNLGTFRCLLQPVAVVAGVVGCCHGSDCRGVCVVGYRQ